MTNFTQLKQIVAELLCFKLYELRKIIIYLFNYLNRFEGLCILY